MTIEDRITINGDVVLYLGAGTLYAKKGIELSEGNSLTIEGPGALVIEGCDYGKSGIGAQFLGSITINGGTINVKGGGAGAGIGSDSEPGSGGTITINGGIINATGGTYDWRPNGVLFYRGGAGIGGGAHDQWRSGDSQRRIYPFRRLARGQYGRYRSRCRTPRIRRYLLSQRHADTQLDQCRRLRL